MISAQGILIQSLVKLPGCSVSASIFTVAGGFVDAKLGAEIKWLFYFLGRYCWSIRKFQCNISYKKCPVICINCLCLSLILFLSYIRSNRSLRSQSFLSVQKKSARPFHVWIWLINDFTHHQNLYLYSFPPPYIAHSSLFNCLNISFYVILMFVIIILIHISSSST